MKEQTCVPQDYDVFAGLDVDKRSISVTFTNHQGFNRSLCMPRKGVKSAFSFQGARLRPISFSAMSPTLALLN